MKEVITWPASQKLSVIFKMEIAEKRSYNSYGQVGLSQDWSVKPPLHRQKLNSNSTNKQQSTALDNQE